MQSRLTACFILVVVLCGLALGVSLSIESAQKLSIQQIVERDEYAQSIAEKLPPLLDKSDLDETEIRRLLQDEAGSDRTIQLYKEGTWLVGDTQNPAVIPDPTERHTTVWPWTDGDFVVSEFFTVADDFYELRVATSTDPSQTAVSKRLSIIFFTMLTTILALSAASFFLGAWAMQPIRQLDQTAQRISSGDLSARAVVGSGAPELEHLASSFNEMAERLTAGIQRERLFVSSASHHFGNLLTPLRIRIESMNRMDVKVASTLAELDRLESVSERLIQLNQAEESRSEPIPLDVVPIVEDSVRSWQPVSEQVGVELTYKCPAVALAWVVPGALEEALDNLIDNSIKYGGGTPVTVQVIRGLANIRVIVSDKGPGLPDELIEAAFGRFWRGADHQNQPGSGLGLAIIQALAEGSDCEFTMRNAPRGGLESSFVLRRASNEGLLDNNTPQSPDS